MKNKYCRICWNTNGWRKPSGAAAETGDSYIAQNRFGHEEWFFNYEWCLGGYKYSFLQPINKNRETYEGQSFSAALYTKNEALTLLVAEISNVYAPLPDELRKVFDEMNARGWLDQMRDEISAVDGRPADLADPTPHLVINVRFHPDDVTFYDPMPIFDSDHKVSKTNRYQAYDWDESQIPVSDRASTSGCDDPTRKELLRLRAAQQTTTIDPKHVRLQNRLYNSLCTRYGRDAVSYEKDFVDLQVVSPDEHIFFEIKTDSSAKMCLRNAIGQLLEYSIYPSKQRADRLVVVGDSVANSNDIEYLSFLRSCYSIPVFYARFDWESSELGDFL